MVKVMIGELIQDLYLDDVSPQSLLIEQEVGLAVVIIKQLVCTVKHIQIEYGTYRANHDSYILSGNFPDET
jgi:hypothetical protein